MLASLLADAGALHEPSAALGAAARHLDNQGLGKGTLRVSRAGQKAAEAAGLDHHVAPADVALLLADLVGHLNIHALHVLLHLVEILIEIAVEFSQQSLPILVAGLHLVQLFFHVGGEFHIHDLGKSLAHEVIDHRSQGGHAQILTLLDHILPVQNGGYRGGIGGGAADAVFFQGADKGRIRKMRRGLGEMLGGLHLFQIHRFPLLQGRQGRLFVLFFLIPALLVHGGIAGKFQAAGAGAEAMCPGLQLGGNAVIHGVCHLAGQKTAPNQPVQPILLSGEIALHLLGSQRHIAGTDGLVGVLSPGLGLVLAEGVGAVIAAVAAVDQLPGGHLGLAGDAQGVGTHVGDETHGALAGNLHALI